MSAIHAYEARKAFAVCISGGEARVNLAEAALHIASEDDAIGRRNGQAGGGGGGLHLKDHRPTLCWQECGLVDVMGVSGRCSAGLVIWLS